jgi:hypothetical protein
MVLALETVACHEPGTVRAFFKSIFPKANGFRALRVETRAFGTGVKPQSALWGASESHLKNALDFLRK